MLYWFVGRRYLRLYRRMATTENETAVVSFSSCRHKSAILVIGFLKLVEPTGDLKPPLF